MNELLRRCKITQTQLAKELGVTQSLVSQWARKICQPNIEQIPIIAQFLGVTSDEIIACFTKMKEEG